ncbi:MAG: histidinol-phosphatase [Candidatus Odinarchaeota archaeon]
MFDYHVHPGYSIDAEGSVEDFCHSALERGLKEIAFTTHLDTDTSTDDCFVVVQGERVETLSGGWLEDYEMTIRAAEDKYRELGLKVLLGVEVDYIPNVESILPEQFYSTDFDIVLGSAHLVDHIAISAGDRARDAFRRYTIEELGERYYGLLLDAIETGLFDIMSHLDLYRRFGQVFYGEKIREIWRSYLDDLVMSMRRNNVGFEINTSPLRRGQEEPMPEENIVRALKESGVTTVTVGSDAHSPDHVGAGIEKAIQILKRVGFSSVTTFDHRVSSTHDI